MEQIFNLRIDSALYQEFKALAKENRRSINSEMLLAIEAYLEQQRQKRELETPPKE